MTDIDRPLPDRTIYLMLRMKPPWVFIDEIRRFVESFCACACPGQGREAQLALAVHELMQNAIPHARGGHVDLVLEVEPSAERVSVEVSNPCTDEEYAALSARVAAMYAEPDALTSYLRAMKESPATTRGGLGLPRIRFESQLDIRTARKGGRVTVEASGPLRPPPLAIVGGRHA
jgi:anti-sigma regulatory factor (Ser/Thr protein kinase)